MSPGQAGLAALQGIWRAAAWEGWGDKVPAGGDDFARAAGFKDGETVVFAWVLWPDKATADACEASMQSDERWQKVDMPFDGNG